MTDQEQACFSQFLRRAASYVEFGCGGSTLLASKLVSGAVTSVDSSKKWLKRVRAESRKNADCLPPKLIHVDIGRIGKWGRPIDRSTIDRWPEYSSGIWNVPGTRDADLYLVDGRFRVACFMQTLLHCKPDALVLFHDYICRPKYHVVEAFARPVFACGTLCGFVRRSDFDQTCAGATLQRYRTNAY